MRLPWGIDKLLIYKFFTIVSLLYYDKDKN